MSLLFPTKGFDKGTSVKAAETRRAVDAKGRQVRIKAGTPGIADSSKVDHQGNQFVHFEDGPRTPCVNWPVEALYSA